MKLLMDDRSIKKLVEILYNVLVRVDRFIFLTDFLVLDCDMNVNVLIIFG